MYELWYFLLISTYLNLLLLTFIARPVVYYEIVSPWTFIGCTSFIIAILKSWWNTDKINCPEFCNTKKKEGKVTSNIYTISKDPIATDMRPENTIIHEPPNQNVNQFGIRTNQVPNHDMISQLNKNFEV